MKLAVALILLAAVAAGMIIAMRPTRPRCSGFSFAHPGGDCVVWYARDGDRILDMIIAPRGTFATCYQAAAMRLVAGDREVAFGNTHTAYICEEGVWRSVPLFELRESDLPSPTELAQCLSTNEIARRVVGR
jgi:hypothetical protein